MTARKFIAGHIIACAIMAGIGLGAQQAHGAPLKAKAVALSDASTAPSTMVYLFPGGSVTYGEGSQCPRAPKTYWQDVSAYDWTGAPLKGQQWHRSGPFPYTYWGSPYGSAVTFDGITFTNHTPRAVLVAGWCH